MLILIDTAEQTPWTFEGQGVETYCTKLKTGDYSVAGLEERVTIERKSLSDWIRTVTRERSRFYRELDRMQSYDFRCVIIEATVREIVAGNYRSQARPESVLGFIHEITVVQSVPVMLGGTRAECQIHAAGLLRMAAQKLGGMAAPQSSPTR